MDLEAGREVEMFLDALKAHFARVGRTPEQTAAKAAQLAAQLGAAAAGREGLMETAMGLQMARFRFLIFACRPAPSCIWERQGDGGARSTLPLHSSPQPRRRQPLLLRLLTHTHPLTPTRTLPKSKITKTKPKQVENVALLSNSAANGFVGVNLYADDEGALKV